MIDLNLATADEVAAALGLSKQTLAHWRVAKVGPPYVTIGRRVRYPIAALKEWVSGQVQLPAGTQTGAARRLGGYKTKRR